MKKKSQYSIESLVVAFVLVTMLALVFIGVLSRYVFHFSFSFTEELVCAMFVLLSTMGGALASKTNSHYTLDLLTGALKPGPRRILEIIDTLLTTLGAGVLCYTSILMVLSQRRMGSMSIALKIPSWIYGAFVPLGLLFIIYRSVETVIRQIKTKPEQIDRTEGNAE